MKEQYEYDIGQITTEGFYIVDNKGKFSSVNEVYAEMIGYTVEELETMSIYDIEAIESKEDTDLHIADIIKKGEIHKFKTKLRRKDGKIINVEISVRYHYKDERMICFIRKLDNNHVETHITENLINLKLINQHEGDFIILVDDEPNILSAMVRCLRPLKINMLLASNAEDALELMELNSIKVIICDEKMPHMKGSELFPILKNVYPDIIRILLTGYANIESTTKAINEGDIYRFLMKPWNDNMLQFIVASALDKYDLNLLIKEARRTLEAKVIKKTEQLQNMLIISNNLVIQSEAANKAKNEFMRTMSHELRTPLNGIIGFSDILLTTELTDKQKNFVEKLKISGCNLLTIITNILQMSRLEANVVDLESNSFLVRDVLISVIDEYDSQIIEKGLKLLTAFEEEEETYVLGDSNKFRIIINNIVSNAVKFTKVGSIEIRSFIDFKTSVKIQYKIVINDTGIGVKAEDVFKMFKPFSQVDASLSRSYGGSGLGLAISKGLLELMGGEIKFSSVNNGGSVFTIIIPFMIDKNKEIK